MSEKLFEQGLINSADSDLRIALSKPGQKGAKNMLWSKLIELIGLSSLLHNNILGRGTAGAHPSTAITHNGKVLSDVLGNIDWGVVTVSSDVNPAVPYTYYRINASVAPRTVYLPDPVEGSTDEFSIELHADTHKVKVTTVSEIAGAIEDNDYVYVPTEGGSIRLKCDGANGYYIIEDHRNLWTRQVISEDRDFSTDGPENNMIYDIQPSGGGTINITFPAPMELLSNKVLRSSFVLTAPGSAVFTAGGSNIGDKTTQIITTLQKGFTIGIFDSKYNIIQDSRPSASQNVNINFYSLQEASDVGGYRKLVTSTSDSDYNPVTQEEESAVVSSETFTTFLSYAATAESTPSVIESGNMQFNVNVKKTTATQANVTVRYLIYKRDSGGTETLLATSSQFTVTQTTYQPFTLNLPIPRTELAETDRLVKKVQYAKTVGAGNPTLTTKYEGTEPAYFSILVDASSINHNSLDNRDLPDSHPITSITGLLESLNLKADLLLTPTNSEKLALLKIVGTGQHQTTNKYYVRTQAEFLTVFEDTTDPVKYIECIQEIDFPINPVVGSSETYISGVKMTASNGVSPQNDLHVSASVYFRNSIVIGNSTITPDNDGAGDTINIFFKNIISTGGSVGVVLGGAVTGSENIYYNDVSENVKLLGTAVRLEWDQVTDLDKETWYNTNNADCKLIKGIRYGNRFSLEVEFISRDQVADDTVVLFPSTWADSVRASFDKTEVMCKSTDPTAVTPTVTIAPYFDSVAGLVNIDLDGVIAGVAIYEGTIHRNDQGDGGTAYKENGKVLPQANSVIFTVNQDSGNTDGLVFKATITGTLTNFYQ